MTQLAIDPPVYQPDEDDYVPCRMLPDAVWGEVCPRPHMEKVGPQYICWSCGECGHWPTLVWVAEKPIYNADLDTWSHTFIPRHMCGACVAEPEHSQCRRCDNWYHCDVDEMAGGVCMHCHEKAVR